MNRIEHTLTAVHGHTTTLVQRVPANLQELLNELREQLILRLASAWTSAQSTESVRNGAVNRPTEPDDSPADVLRSLTPQERQVFQVCFQSGFLSYRDIAAHLDITAGAAKNLVNRMLQSQGKRSLLTKRYRHGTATVGLNADIERRILAADSRQRSRPVRGAA